MDYRLTQFEDCRLNIYLANAGSLPARPEDENSLSYDPKGREVHNAKMVGKSITPEKVGRFMVQKNREVHGPSRVWRA